MIGGGGETQARIDDDLVTLRQTLHVSAQHVDDARPVAPGDVGEALGGGKPIDIQRSSRLRADMATFTLTWPGAGSGVATSAIL